MLYIAGMLFALIFGICPFSVVFQYFSHNFPLQIHGLAPTTKFTNSQR